MTQAPATPELVERLKAMASMPFTRFHYADDAVMVKQAAAALEAQQARIAELEDENEQLRLAICGVGPSDLTDPRSQHSDGGHDV